MSSGTLSTDKWKQVHDVLVEYGEAGVEETPPADAMTQLHRLLPDRKCCAGLLC